MTNVWAVSTRELRSYFLSPLAYVVIALFLALSGYLFALILANGREASLRGLIQNVSVLYLFIVPAISMRLLAEEQRTGTVELLLTNPVQEWEIVTGGFGLMELRPAHLSLEEIFLQLTTSEAPG